MVERLKERIIFRSYALTSDDQGGSESVTYTDVDEIWASFESQGSDVSDNQDRKVITKIGKFFIRYRTDISINEDLKVYRKKDGTTWDILDIQKSDNEWFYEITVRRDAS